MVNVEDEADPEDPLDLPVVARAFLFENRDNFFKKSERITSTMDYLVCAVLLAA